MLEGLAIIDFLIFLIIYELLTISRSMLPKVHPYEIYKMTNISFDAPDPYNAA